METRATSILLIEDDAADARRIRELLRKRSGWEHHLLHVATLAEALQRLETTAIDAVLLGTGLPDGDRLTAVTRINEAAPAVPIVVLDGFSDERLAWMALREGAQDVLAKERLDDDRLTRAIRFAIERKRVETSLRDGEARLRSLTELAGEAMISTDGRGRIGVWNAAAERIFGYERQEAVGRPLAELVPQASRETSETFGLRAVCKDGRAILLDASTTRTGRGEGTRFDFVLRRSAAHETAEPGIPDPRTPRARWPLTRQVHSSRVSYEIRSLLNVILNEAAVAETRLADLGDLTSKPRFDGIRRAGERMVKMLHQALETPRQDARTFELQPARLELGRFVQRQIVEPHRPQETKRTATVEGAAGTAGGAKPSVLVVEDDPDTQRLMRLVLGRTYDVVVAASGEETRRELEARPNDIRMILMDVALRGGEDGLGLTEALRHEERWKNLPIIATTACALPGDRAKALAAGCTGYLAKPIASRELLSMMGKLLA
jgi:PAS domain S-box-containing protein